jgi:hypothetical protein
VHLGHDWFCSSECLAFHTEQMLAGCDAPRPRWTPVVPQPVGAHLVQQKAVTPEMLDVALVEQRRTGRRLGAQLLAMGLVTREELVRALAAQAGVGYIVNLDPGRVAGGPGGLSRQTVRALGLVPFESSQDGERLAVACVAPLPRLALSAIREITGARIDAFLVADEEWDRLADAYATGQRATQPAVPSTTLRSIPDAAVRIALAAAHGSHVRIHHARCDPFVWVRVEGGARREDLLVPLGTHEGEHAWQAAPTQH